MRVLGAELLAEPTPGMRCIWSSTREAMMLLSSAASGPPGRTAGRRTEESGVRFRDPDALLVHFRRQARLRERHAVLRLHRRDVGIRCRCRRSE